MKRLLTLFFALVLCQNFLFAQYTSENSFIRKAYIVYTLNDKGFWDKKEDVMVDNVLAVESILAYDKKAQNLYVRTNTGLYVVTLNKDYAKIIKKNNSIPQLKAEEITPIVQSAKKSIEQKFDSLNEAHRKALEAARIKAYNDSVAAVRKREQEERDRLAAIAARDSAYKAQHPKWTWLPVKGLRIKCEDCGRFCAEDSVLIAKATSDSIYFFTYVEGDLETYYLKLHIAPIEKDFFKNEDFKLHCQVYKDSLENGGHTELNKELVKSLNDDLKFDSMKKIMRKAPYGYFDGWGWDDDFSVSFYFNYVNTNEKTIKYIDVYWKITNGVNDVRKTGHFQGTGPLEFWQSAKWNWESSSYYVAGDASNMQITKVIITYMNGTKKILTGNQIQFNTSSEDNDQMKSYYY